MDLLRIGFGFIYLWLVWCLFRIGLRLTSGWLKIYRGFISGWFRECFGLVWGFIWGWFRVGLDEVGSGVCRFGIYSGLV